MRARSFETRRHARLSICTCQSERVSACLRAHEEAFAVNSRAAPLRGGRSGSLHSGSPALDAYCTRTLPKQTHTRTHVHSVGGFKG